MCLIVSRHPINVSFKIKPLWIKKKSNSFYKCIYIIFSTCRIEDGK